MIDILEQVYQLSAENKEQAACVELLSYMEDKCRRGQFSEVDALLAAIDTEAVGPSTLLTVASFSSHAKQHLKERDAFMVKAEAELVEKLGKERTDKLLKTRR